MRKNIVIIVLSVLLAFTIGILIYQNFISTKEEAFDSENIVPSMFELISNTDKYNGKIIKAEGYLEFNDERTALYLLKEYCDEKIFKNAVWIDVCNLNDDALAELESLDGKFVFIKGLYDKRDCGPDSAFSGSIKNIMSWKLEG